MGKSTADLMWQDYECNPKAMYLYAKELENMSKQCVFCAPSKVKPHICSGCVAAYNNRGTG